MLVVVVVVLVTRCFCSIVHTIWLLRRVREGVAGARTTGVGPDRSGPGRPSLRGAVVTVVCCDNRGDRAR